MRKSAMLGTLAVLTVGLLTSEGGIGTLAAVVLAGAAYLAVGSEFGPSPSDVSAKVETLRSLATRSR